MRILLLVLLVLGGCKSSFDRMKYSDFEANRNGEEFTFRALADSAYPLNEPEGEETRIRWMEEALTRNKLCLNGYVILKRQVLIKHINPLGAKFHDVYYYGKCN